MDSNMFYGLGQALKFMYIALWVAVPLALWKVIDIVIWLFTNVTIGIT